jgi:hypothetical protein
MAYHQLNNRQLKVVYDGIELTFFLLIFHQSVLLSKVFYESRHLDYPMVQLKENKHQNLDVLKVYLQIQ